MKIDKNKILDEVNKVMKDTQYVIETLRKDGLDMQEGSGADAIFLEIQSKLPKAIMADDNVIDCSMYQETQIVNSLKGLGFQFKKVLDRKLHFYNPQTSISLYLAQGSKHITLVP